MQTAPTWKGFILLALTSVTAAGSVASCTHEAARQPALINEAGAVPDLPGGAGHLPVPALTGDEAIRQSLDSLSDHGLDPAAYFSNTQSARDAWLLAATHLSGGVVDPRTQMARNQPHQAFAAILERLPPESGPDDFAQALQQLAPQSSLYMALKAELGQQPVFPQLEERDRALSLLASLEKLRRLPGETHERHVLANIPGFDVITFENGAEVSRRAAVVGQISRQTPEFSDEIEFVIFNPWWEVPASIAVRDKLPQFRRDPGTITRLGYKIHDLSGQQVNPAEIDWNKVSANAFPYRIRQAPGSFNALGQVKFIFPNVYDVYLHDTPEKSLFTRTDRAFSSGCIRVSDPLGLAEWVLAATPGWGRERIDEVVRTGRETRASLAARLPVHIVYLTAFPASDGQIAYLQDVYGRDPALLAAMNPYLEASLRDASLAGPLADAGAARINDGHSEEETYHGDCLYRSG